MTTDQLHKTLNESPSLSGYEAVLKRYLIDQVARYDGGQDMPQDIAYEMAGLMSAEALFRTPNDNPYKEILSLAGELELPDAHHGGASWSQLKSLVRKLP